MSERSPGEGRYARLEREQRWLLAAVPEQAHPRSEILDRYVLVMPWGLGELVVDRFQGRLDGLVLAEAEVSPDDGLLELPPFALSDVTRDDRYSGGALAHASAQELASLLGETPGHPPR